MIDLVETIVVLQVENNILKVENATLKADVEVLKNQTLRVLKIADELVASIENRAKRDAAIRELKESWQC